MRDLQIAERLEQIVKAGIPIATKAGNQLPRNGTMDFVGYAAQGVPELVIDFYEGPFANTRLNNAAFYVACMRLTEVNSPESELQQKYADWKSTAAPNEFPMPLETHAFYDPHTDLTHFFPLPAIEL